MSDGTIRIVIAGALALHGLGHFGAMAALAWLRVSPASNTGGWLAARSWLVPSLPEPYLVASAFWAAALVGFLLAAAGFWGVLVPADLWRPLAVVAAVVSIAGIVLFAGTWPSFNTIAALGMNVAVLVALLGLHWPPETLFGR